MAIKRIKTTIGQLCNILKCEEEKQIIAPDSLKVLSCKKFQKVLGLYKTNKRKLMQLVLENNQQIKGVAEHKVLCDSGWKCLKDIDTNDCVKIIRNYCKVKEIKELDDTDNCYDLQVENSQCYNGNNIINHNTEMFVKLAADINLRSLIVVNRTALLAQISDKLKKRLDFRESEINVIGADRRHYDEKNFITIGTFQSLMNDKYDEILEKAEMVIFDECLNGGSKILLENNITKRISDIYFDEKITHVMSYNLQEKRYELKKILRKIRKVRTEKYLHIYVKYDKNIVILKCTANHKIYTKNREYVRADELTTNDIIVYNTSNPTYYKETEEYACAMKLVKLNAMKVCNVKRNNNKHYIRQLSDRMRGSNNPLKNAEIVAKQKMSIKKTYELYPEKLLARKKNFIRAPRVHSVNNKNIKPTCLEQFVLDLKLSELDYTAQGDYFVDFGFKHRCPDFVVRGCKKVIEVGDDIYWYKRGDAERLIENYSKAGYECLFLSGTEIHNTPEIAKGKILKFVYNHDLKVHAIKVAKGGCKMGYVYNLEIEDNHNFFADNILVSNCHHVAANRLGEIAEKCKKARVRFGFSATPWREDGREMEIEAFIGPKIVEVSISKLIKEGYLVKPKIYFINTLNNADPRLSYDKLYKFLVDNPIRNGYVAQAAYEWAKRGKLVLISILRVRHAKIIYDAIKKIDDVGLEVKIVTGSNDVADKIDTIEKLNIGHYNIVISTLFGEGVDVPNLDCLINVRAVKSAIDAFQQVGRALRKPPEKSNKENAFVLDFLDYNPNVKEWNAIHDHKKTDFFKRCATKRKKLYESEPEFSVKVIDKIEEIFEGD